MNLPAAGFISYLRLTLELRIERIATKCRGTVDYDDSMTGITKHEAVFIGICVESFLYGKR